MAAVATRPDLSYALSETSRCLEKPTKNHDNAVDRIENIVSTDVIRSLTLDKMKLF